MKIGRKQVVAALAGVAILLTSIALAPAYAVPSYPTAGAVAAAKANVQEKQTMLARI